jgi:hypothetical protein
LTRLGGLARRLGCSRCLAPCKCCLQHCQQCWHQFWAPHTPPHPSPPCTAAELQYSNIVPTRSASSSSARLWRRYLQEDFSHHA